MSIVGTTINWGEDQPVELPPPDRRRHVYLIWQTGTGKTTLLRNLILQDIHEGRGVGFIDPYGGRGGRAARLHPAASNRRCCLLHRRVVA
jgi:DNA helicase HerA-like ATPase